MKLGPEDKVQLAVLEYLETVIAEPFILHHSPNGGRRSISEAKKFKLLGVRAGWSDLCLITGRGTFFFELKAGRGRPTPEQEDFMSEARSLGCGTAVCKTIDDVRNALRAWGIRTREVAP